MKMEELVPNISTMTDEELLAHVRSIRQRRYQPQVTRAKRETAVKETSTEDKARRRALKKLASLTPEQVQQLLERVNNGQRDVKVRGDQ